MTVSFGIEFEFDYVKPNNEIVVYEGRRPYYLAENWGYQPDYTASSELRSPVFISLEQYVSETTRQFRGMVEHSREIIPYMCNSPRRSLGQHMHIGKPNRELRQNEKRKIARAIIEFYPFFASIQAQPIPSHRGLNSRFTISMREYNNFISLDHYAEISDSHNGTVELRIFDANLPQVSLVNAFFITKIADKVLRSRRITFDSNFDFARYHEERTNALRYGLVGINVTRYLKKIRDILGNIELPNIPAIKEILYLVARYRLNPYGVWSYVRASRYDYMKANLMDTSKYLENLLEINNIQHRDKVEQWIEEAKEVENLEQLIGISIAVDDVLARALVRAIESRELRRRTTTHVRTRAVLRGLGRSEVRRAISEGRYAILRINELSTMSRERVAERISELLRLHGEGFVNTLTPNEVIEAPDRFYVFVAYDSNRNIEQICGTIAVHVRRGRISSIVVDRRFRGLGIGRRLIEHAIRVLRDNGVSKIYMWVRRNNERMLRLAENFGFEITRKGERSYRLELRA